MLKSTLRLLVCLVFFFGGIGHFLLAADFAGIVPPTCRCLRPANIDQVLSDIPIFGGPVAPELLWLRIPLQFF
ncbi:hypothetical protein [Zhongshania sp.]|uniref:hypothetical protein n=1 Tax=Zhongshania sp. TaxID=1971902 RepID=UPI003563813D